MTRIRPSTDATHDARFGVTPDPLLLPRLPTRLVARPRAFRRLDRMDPVTLVDALPGFGKTTLVASWARERADSGAHVVWIRASAELDDVPTFLDQLHRGLVRSGALRPPAVEAHPPSGGEPDWFDELAVSARPVIVAVDDAHRLRDPTVADTLLSLASRAHPLHVVACSDTDHHFHDAAERHALDTNVLRGSDLAIAADQVSAFAEAWGHELDAEGAAALHELVGGWLLPLRLVLDATPSWADAFAAHVGQDFLMTTVLPGITDSAGLNLAMRCAVPERLDAALATRLLAGSHDGDDTALGELAAASLERQGLLWRVPRHDGAAQWRYPRLVRHAFLAELERSQPDVARRAHREVALARADGGDAAHHSELLRHARSAGEWALLSRLWTEHGWSLAGADPAAFEFAYADLPALAREELEPLVVAGSVGDALAATSDQGDWMHRVETLLRHYMQTGTDHLRDPQPVASPMQHVELLTAGMIAMRTEGHLDEAAKLAAHARRELSRARQLEPERVRTSQVAWFHVQDAITQMLRGDHSAALDLARRAHQIGPTTLIGAGAAGLLAALNAVTGHAGDARAWLETHESVDLSGNWASDLAVLPARIARAKLAQDRLDAAAADGELVGVPLGPDASGLWPLILSVHVGHALVFGDPVAALARLDHAGRQLARHLGGDSTGSRMFDRCTLDLMLAMGEVNRVQARIPDGPELEPLQYAPVARFHLMTGEAKQAGRIASAGVWHQDLTVSDLLELLVISARASHAQGEWDTAVETFRRAHALVQDTGDLKPLLLVPADLRVALLEATGLALDPDAAARLAAARPIYPERAELVRLSPRELEVLRRMRLHETSSALARDLSVSVNTVKKQLVSLYAKLGVNDRSSALLRAQRLGLVDDLDATDGPDHGAASPTPEHEGRSGPSTSQ